MAVAQLVGGGCRTRKAYPLTRNAPQCGMSIQAQRTVVHTPNERSRILIRARCRHGFGDESSQEELTTRQLTYILCKNGTPAYAPTHMYTQTYTQTRTPHTRPRAHKHTHAHRHTQYIQRHKQVTCHKQNRQNIPRLNGRQIYNNYGFTERKATHSSITRNEYGR